jgi:hypothetical protein
VEHSDEWTNGSEVSQTDFLRRWLLEYLPVIRVVPDEAIPDSLLSPEETARTNVLAQIDHDDVPSVKLALVLGALYLSNDSPALQAVYGSNADLTEHAEWLEVLKAGGDAGELGRMVHVTIAILAFLGSGVIAGAKRVAAAVGPWGFVLLGLAAALLLQRTSDNTRQRLKSAAAIVGTALLQVYAAYQAVLIRFERAAPTIPGWDALAATNDPAAVLTRACLHTLARSPMSDRSAKELAQQLPWVGVAQGEAKVRHTLRSHGCFFEVWRGRW